MNPLQIALLRWYDATTVGTFSVANTTYGIAFDGAYIWVTSYWDSVTKLRVTDGGLVGSYTVGDKPRGIAFDGASVWITNYGIGTVSKR